jgi:hypothetical protein
MSLPTVEIQERASSAGAAALPHHRTAEWKLVERILASPGFSKSPLLARFLTYICDRKLRGRESEITEHQIGMVAFGRPGSYHPGEDNIVRNYARTLRVRLDAYFLNAGATEPMRVSIPRGRYIPIFEANVPASAEADEVHEAASLPLPEPNVETGTERRFRFPHILKYAAAAALLVAGGFGARVMHVQSSPFDTFWSTMLDPHRSTYVIAADSGFAVLQDLTGRQVHLHEYVSEDIGTIFPKFDTLHTPENQTYGPERFSNYTSTADLNSVLDLVHLPQFLKAQTRVRYARDIRMDDIRNANVILIGGPHANPWVELYEPQSDFRLTIPTQLSAPQLDNRVIVNKRPQPGEQPTYSITAAKDIHATYSILSFLPGTDRANHALLFQGGNMAATQATADFAVNEVLMAPILAKARRPDGHIGSFELVLETRTVGASAPQAHVVIAHYHAD